MYKRSGNTFQIVRISKTPCIYIYIRTRSIYAASLVRFSQETRARFFSEGGRELQGVFRVRVERNAKGGFLISYNQRLYTTVIDSVGRNWKQWRQRGSGGELMGREIDYLVGLVVTGW